MTSDRRLIEDYLPLDALNAIASKEKKHPRRYVELVHYWPARRPITACRAAIYATLAPAPGDARERDEAVAFITKLASYAPDSQTLSEAAARVKKLHDGRAPKVLDLFAGGGAIPLEAARLGCESHAVDYNPVAHLIELCTLVYPQTFGPTLANEFKKWSDVILDRMRDEISDLYAPIEMPRTEEVNRQDELFGTATNALGGHADPVSYIWVRTVPCRRPGCAAPVPLARQSWLRTKGGAIAAVPRVEDGSRLCWRIVAGSSAREVSQHTGRTGSGQAVCVACNTPAPASYVKEMAVAGRMGESLAAIVAALPPKKPAGKKQRKVYLSSDSTEPPNEGECHQRLETLLADSAVAPLVEEMNTADSTTVAGRGYGISLWRELFTPRQLLVLFTLVKHIRRAHQEMLDQGLAEAQARALTTFFGMAFGRFVKHFSKFGMWLSRDQITDGAIGPNQALKMVWSFSEINPLASTTGCLQFALENEAFCIRELAKVATPAVATRGNSEKLFYDDEIFDAVVTDPPYYSSIYYADLSAFFYVWLKRIVGDLYPEHFAFAAPPKRREAVAQPSEHGGDAEKAKEHYERLMRSSLAEARRVLKPGAPLVCVYAHRTTEGWATLIRALVGAGMTVTEAWPVQTESRGRVNALGAAALSDSIFFVARRREQATSGQYETQVEPLLHEIARERIKTLWNNGKGIGGADLLMAAVGAGLRAYTQFARVDYANGEPVSAERYLRDVEGAVLDVMLDEIFGLRGAAVAAVDSVTRFYILWRFTYREAAIEAGDVYVFCYPQGIEIDGPEGLTGDSPKLVEKDGTKFRVRNFAERGEDEALGFPTNGKTAPLVDVLHRLLHLLEERPAAVGEFLQTARPNTEQLRLVAQALAAPVLGRTQAQDASPTAELGALARLNANWRAIVEGAAYAQEIESLAAGTGDLFSGDQQP